MEESFQISRIISRKIKGTISLEEEKELQRWREKRQSNEELFDKLLNNHQHSINKVEDYQRFDTAKIWLPIEKELFETKLIRLKFKKLLRYAAVFIPFIMIVSLTYLWWDSSTSSLANIDDFIQPWKGKATLILANGDSLDLQKEKSGIISDGKAQLNSLKNSLAYTTKANITEINPLVYHTLVTPRGGNYQLTLSDGTQVWLNANSSIKYPVDFTDSTREVFLEGEAFFDVQHNGKPFLVNAQQTNIRVLGTSFNVTAYYDELNTITTLVEGSVKLSTSEAQRILVPNEQASISINNKEIHVKEVNTNLFTSWKDGKIEFESENLEKVMRRLARLYDFEYSFENEAAKDYHFTARIDNSQPISSILEMLEMTTEVEFKLNKKTIIIL